MADYKVVNVDKLESDLTAVADAIRVKTGGTELLSLDEMASEISKLSNTSGDTAINTYSVTVTFSKMTAGSETIDYYTFSENGTMTAGNYSSTNKSFSLQTNETLLIHRNLSSNSTSTIAASTGISYKKYNFTSYNSSGTARKEELLLFKVVSNINGLNSFSITIR